MRDKNTIDMFADTAAVMQRAKADIMEKAHGDGGECPCCGQFVKVYRRTINSTMARQLITAWHKHGAGNWFHTRDVVMVDSSGAGDFSKLENWGLITRQEHQQGDEGKRSSGYWRITPLGSDFVQGRVKVQQYALIYNNNLLGMDGALIEIRHALGSKFDYREIMGWTGQVGATPPLDTQQQPGA